VSRASRLGMLFALCCAAAARGQEPRIDVRVDTFKQLWVGQQVSLSVTIMAPGYFDSATRFDLPDPEGVLLMPPEGNPVVGNQTIDGVMYTTRLHQLRAWPMRAGTQDIPPLTIRFAYKAAPLDPDSIDASVTSESIPLAVEQPPGTEGMGTVISARSLRVEENWQPAPGSGSVEAGSAFTRTITFSAPDVPGMIFPAFPADDIDGLGVYSKLQVRDHSEARGGLVGERREVLSYVCKEPGQFTIPAVEFRWFDLDTKQVKTESFAAHTLDVVPNPALVSGSGQSAAAKASGGGEPGYVNLSRLGYLFPGLLLLLYVGTRKRFRALVCRLAQNLRPRHLQPLNPSAPCKGAISQWVRFPPGNCRSSR
jgi:hypothetical protein